MWVLVLAPRGFSKFDLESGGHRFVSRNKLSPSLKKLILKKLIYLYFFSLFSCDWIHNILFKKRKKASTATKLREFLFHCVKANTLGLL